MSDLAQRVFISYSHDSEEHRQRVLDLANKLRDDGIDVRIDRYVAAPPEGWPRWMQAQINEAQLVLVVCTDIYRQRVEQNAAPGVGLGALWESHIIYNLLYQAGTMNAKFIPVLPPGGKVEHIPIPLLSAQRYYPFEEGAGYSDLYRLITDQPAVVMPPLGTRKTLPAFPRAVEAHASAGRVPVTCSNSPRAGIWTPGDGTQAFIPVIESEWQEQKAVLCLEPDDPGDGAFIDTLSRHGEIYLAFRHNVASATLGELQHRTKAGKDQWTITFRLREKDFGHSMEVSMNGLTPSDAATLRARRLLLNENPAKPASRNSRDMKGIFEEIAIAGQGTPIQVNSSPFPPLFNDLQHTPQLFVEAAWVMAVMQLKLSNTIEQIIRLELALNGGGLDVQFLGKRRKFYSNQPAFQIKVSGTCPLV